MVVLLVAVETTLHWKGTRVAGSEFHLGQQKIILELSELASGTLTVYNKREIFYGSSLEV